MADSPRSKPVAACGTVLTNGSIAPDVWEMEVAAPELVGLVKPGQFVEVTSPRAHEHILRRPFSVYAMTDKGFIIMFQIVGDVTRALSELRPGDDIPLHGPLGHGWAPPKGVQRALLVAGGLGAASLALLASELDERGVETDVVMGAPSKMRLVGKRHYEDAHCSVSVATDDGSAGHHGFCTDLVSKRLECTDYDYIATCGPEPMQRIVAEQAVRHDVYCEVSLERLMACGIGACLSCVVKTTGGLKRACFDGPVFDAKSVIWDD